MNIAKNIFNSTYIRKRRRGMGKGMFSQTGAKTNQKGSRHKAKPWCVNLMKKVQSSLGFRKRIGSHATRHLRAQHLSVQAMLWLCRISKAFWPEGTHTRWKAEATPTLCLYTSREQPCSFTESSWSDDASWIRGRHVYYLYLLMLLWGEGFRHYN